MNIEDNWFSKAMLLKMLSQNQTIQSSLGKTGVDFSNLFASVLNNLIADSDSEDSPTPYINNDLPEFNSQISSSSLPESMNVDLPQSPTESLGFQSITPDQLNQFLGGKLTGKGQAFVRAGQWYNINPLLLAAISRHETGNGQSRAANEKNNIAGMMGQNGLKSYSSVEESIMDMARNISKNYLGKGLSTISQIGVKYAPIGADNDPSGLNNNWVAGVTKYFNQMNV